MDGLSINFKINYSKTSHRFLLVIAWTSVLYVGYILTNHFQLFPPTTLTLSSLDNAIPFLSWTVIPYLILISGMYLFAFIDNQDDFVGALVALTIAVSINYIVYIIYPTTYPRPPTPVASGVDYDLYRWLISFDKPTNCLPSGHITTPAIGCWYLGLHHKKFRPYLFTVFFVLSLTTLTTKQHYIVDIPAGLLTAAIGIIVAGWLVRYSPFRLSWVRNYWNTSK